ncbi:MAG: restriction endonuclease [Proteobacteria bacterium]|nr:restriction endonuclease [Pseudomonadota bacterium]MBU1687387.1 restriction endonuclease [Pseudomonadota bacterium]
MAVPDFQSFFLPLLKLSADGETHSLKDSYTAMAEVFKLSDDDLAEMLPSGKQTTFKNRVAWANVYLAKALLLERPKRGFFRITERGKELLRANPTTLRVKQLKEYSEFVDFHTTGNKQDKVIDTSSDDERTSTPEEVFESAYQELRNSLASELHAHILSNTPEFFEHLVVKLLVEMGYGGSIKDAGRAMGRSGDEGIDGIIKEDKLGLDVIYIQAKRWQGSVGRPEVQKFVGALHGQRAKKGVFITTGNFTRDAEHYVSTIDPKVVLIDGSRLVELMIDYNLGVSIADTYEIKKIDSDFFIEE